MRRPISWIFLSLLLSSGLIAVLVNAQNTTNDTLFDQLPITEDVRYLVGTGDTLDGIAATFDVGLACLRQTNELAPNASQILVGDILTVSVACPPYSGLAQVPVPRPGAQEQGGGEGTYTVQFGDTLSAIALRFDVAVQSLQAANNIDTPGQLQAGQVLTIPTDAPPFSQTPPTGPTLQETDGGLVYTMQPGDTLSLVGVFYNANPACLAQVNEITNTTRIQPGTQILVPQACAPFEEPTLIQGRILSADGTGPRLQTSVPTDSPTDAPPAATNTPAPTMIPPSPTMEVLPATATPAPTESDPTSALEGLSIIDALQALSELNE
jgi:LysM repeat protein